MTAKPGRHFDSSPPSAPTDAARRCAVMQCSLMSRSVVVQEAKESEAKIELLKRTASSFHRFEAASVHDAHLRRRRLVPDIGRSDPSVVRSRQQSERRIVLRGTCLKQRVGFGWSDDGCEEARLCAGACASEPDFSSKRSSRPEIDCSLHAEKRDIEIPGTTWQQLTPSVTRASWRCTHSCNVPWSSIGIVHRDVKSSLLTFFLLLPRLALTVRLTGAAHCPAKHCTNKRDADGVQMRQPEKLLLPSLEKVARLRHSAVR